MGTKPPPEQRVGYDPFVSRLDLRSGGTPSLKRGLVTDCGLLTYPFDSRTRSSILRSFQFRSGLETLIWVSRGVFYFFFFWGGGCTIHATEVRFMVMVRVRVRVRTPT